eukprot:Rhum_TRINITY_DN612_c0_g1::Rhum_TRINITY_DN612_c0_g1_i1::g.1970::m.1970
MMLKRTVPALWVNDASKFGNHHGSYLNWTPEIRMLDKDERLPAVSPAAKAHQHLKLNMDAAFTFPPMDPLNPTWEQRRADNTSVNQYSRTHLMKNASRTGFRTIPPELIDWRSTLYGTLLEELPYLNEKTTYSSPDYALAGLVRTKDEELASNSNVPKKVEDGSFGRALNPKIDYYSRYQANRKDRRADWPFMKALQLVLVVLVLGKLGSIGMRQEEVYARRFTKWWDGANPGTWKYGGLRSQYMVQSLAGGHFIPYLEW